MKKALSIFSSKQHRIAVVQYERADYSVGAEEELHWAIIVITDTTYQTGPAFQAIDRHYTNTQEVVWSLFAKDVNLGSTRKCLGGVYVGTVKASDLESLHQVGYKF
ncbi:hypothetical protein OF83DRAFT_426455 [Amylostereum chailletii]|nr:hypothetical protein OF83DRAFT_426455 [Amylostereum chailletii]